jgi:peptidoglycan hydrolase-like protein with peptidoglycan-binding domain
MADPRVEDAQRLVNRYAETVAGIPTLIVDGSTSWTVMYGLRRCLQFQLGMGEAERSNSFTPLTLTRLQQQHPVYDQSTARPEVTEIIQAALYCKGYVAGGIDGVYGPGLEAAFTKLKLNIGLGTQGMLGAAPKVIQAMFNMDAYVRFTSGRDEVREVQQWMNGRYLPRANYFVIPCDGVYSRDAQKAILYAIQYELGMSDSVANGAFGPATKAGLAGKVVSLGAQGVWAQLANALMIFNALDGVTFSGTFSASTASTISNFQQFCRLPITGRVDFSTWASLLVSCGDTSRKGEACDSITEIDAKKAATLYSAGYRVVGRYLCNTVGVGTLDKAIKSGEIATILEAGLRIFPIYQTSGNYATYFNEAKGYIDGAYADQWARHHGFKPGTIIYFAVDFDILGGEITSRLVPHFQGIKSSLAAAGSRYRAGVYAPRLACITLSNLGLAEASFVCGMSYGFSANMGYTLPKNWAYDQISTIGVGSGAGYIEIDNNIYSGRDEGQYAIDAPPPADERPDVLMPSSQWPQLKDEVFLALEAIGEALDVGGPNSREIVVTDIIYSLDSILTQLSQRFKIRKSILQATITYESKTTSWIDVAADALVMEYYTTGRGSTSDSSTGIGQCFGEAAINALNACIEAGLIQDVVRDPSPGRQRYEIWNRLNNDREYAAYIVAIVHLWSAILAGLPNGINYRITDATTQGLFARYNGTGPQAYEYSRKCMTLYHAYEKFNMPARA